jgi:hypothetical protein
MDLRHWSLLSWGWGRWFEVQFQNAGGLSRWREGCCVKWESFLRRPWRTTVKSLFLMVLSVF